MNYDVHIYTDGAAKGNPGKGGYGVVMESKMGKTYKSFTKVLG
jgi:ribonuclease HI